MDAEKIYCCDRDNDNALAAVILTNGGYRRDNDSPWAMAAMMNGGMNGMNGWMNNPFAYLMFLALFRNGGFEFCDWNGGTGAATTQGIEMQAQLNAIRSRTSRFQRRTCYQRCKHGRLQRDPSH